MISLHFIIEFETIHEIYYFLFFFFHFLIPKNGFFLFLFFIFGFIIPTNEFFPSFHTFIVKMTDKKSFKNSNPINAF